MFRRLWNWFGFSAPRPDREVSARAVFAAGRPRPRAIPGFGTGRAGDADGLVHPGFDPDWCFPLFRQMRDEIPDVSAGVWAWVRLCSTSQTCTLDGGTERCREEARAILDRLDRRVFRPNQEKERGVDAIVRCLFLSVFTYGAFCGEAVPLPGRRGVDAFRVVDPATVRFRRARGGALEPAQIGPGGEIRPLNPATFYYFGLDTDGLSPYGRPPLMALPLVVKIQQQLIEDMARAQHNAGYPSLHFRVKTPQRHARETPQAYARRVDGLLESVRDEIARKGADSNLVTLDTLEVGYIGPSGNAVQWSEPLRAVSEQVVSALRLAPFMIGRNWGTTESWGAAQYRLLTNNARSVQEGARRLAEWIRNLELALRGSPCRAVHHFAPHFHLDAAERARAFQTTANALIRLMEAGVLERESARRQIEAWTRFL